jgi:hypothetical protein
VFTSADAHRYASNAKERNSVISAAIIMRYESLEQNIMLGIIPVQHKQDTQRKQLTDGSLQKSLGFILSKQWNSLEVSRKSKSELVSLAYARNIVIRWVRDSTYPDNRVEQHQLDEFSIQNFVQLYGLLVTICSTIFD